MIAYTISGERNISMVINGKQYNVNNSDQNYNNVIALLTDITMEGREDKLLALLDKKVAVETYFQNAEGVEVRNDGIWYEGEQVHNVVVDRIFSFMKANLPFQPMLNFLTKLLQNPSYTSQQQLFYFLEHSSLPICEDGDFLAYKAVTANFLDKHSQKYDNSIGKIVTMPRSRVDDDRETGCSKGLHAGTIGYVRDFASETDKKIIVKINPADVVSVPRDCSNQKLRCCRSEVIREFVDEMQFDLAKNDGEKYSDASYNGNDDDYDDDDAHDDYDWS